MGLTAFVAVFPENPPLTELAFEERLWAELRHLHDCDPVSEWDPAVSSNPDDPRFAYSFAGRAMFVVGLHSTSSRLARRFPWPALVFNPRAQFERLRAEGRFERLRQAVRERDLALQGSLNPNLADFGESSEARQYSGRATEAEWRCPFHRRADA
jgi:FPC/CPF motif-containing protein YcgG